MQFQRDNKHVHPIEDLVKPETSGQLVSSFHKIAVNESDRTVKQPTVTGLHFASDKKVKDFMRNNQNDGPVLSVLEKQKLLAEQFTHCPLFKPLLDNDNFSEMAANALNKCK